MTLSKRNPSPGVALEVDKEREWPKAQTSLKTLLAKPIPESSVLIEMPCATLGWMSGAIAGPLQGLGSCNSAARC